MSVFLLLLVQTLLLIPLSYAYNIKVNVETAADEGNEDTDVYLTLLGRNDQSISQEKKLGKFAEGEIREFEFYTDSPDMECLKFTLKGGTDGWRMERSTVVLENGVTYTFENPRRAKLDNTFPWQESSLKFCSRNTAYFKIVDKAGRNVTGQREGLLLYNGGTVCDDKFSDNSAKAICRAMGRPHRNITWTSYPGDYLYGSVQSGKSIKLDKVECATSEWYQCSFLTAHECKHEEDVFLTCGDDSVAEGLSTKVVIIIAVVAVLIIVLILGCVVYRVCNRRKKDGQQSKGDAEPFRPEAEQAAPSAPPAYDLEMAPPAATGIESLPSYEEVVGSPNRFNSSRSSFRKISSYFRRNNEEQKI